jgi:hypothetical protein
MAARLKIFLLSVMDFSSTPLVSAAIIPFIVENSRSTLFPLLASSMCIL